MAPHTSARLDDRELHNRLDASCVEEVSARTQRKRVASIIRPRRRCRLTRYRHDVSAADSRSRAQRGG